MAPEQPAPGTDFYCEVAIPDPSRLNVVHNDDLVFAFHHTNPGWQTHIVVVPKKHIRSLATLEPQDEPIARRLLEVVCAIARGVDASNGGSGIMTFTGDHQHSRHLHVHVRSGDATEPVTT
jgi:histidine triad (HIT) family protein